MIAAYYTIKTKNSIYEIMVNDKGGSRCRKTNKHGAGPWKDIRTGGNLDYLDALYIGASFDVPGVVLTSVVQDYQHLIPSNEPKRHASINSGFNAMTNAILGKLGPEKVVVKDNPSFEDYS